MIQPDLPNVLHNLNFEINPGEKVNDLTSYDKNLNQSAILRSVFLEEQGPERARWHCRSSDLWNPLKAEFLSMEWTPQKLA